MGPWDFSEELHVGIPCLEPVDQQHLQLKAHALSAKWLLFNYLKSNSLTQDCALSKGLSTCKPRPVSRACFRLGIHCAELIRGMRCSLERQTLQFPITATCIGGFCSHLTPRVSDNNHSYVLCRRIYYSTYP